jgi:DNA-binding SARP family transcriptional activator
VVPTVRQNLRLHLLGDWLLTAPDGVNQSGERIDVSPGPQHLIALLALKGRCARIDAAAALWPDCSVEAASARLRAVLSWLRHRHVAVPPLVEIGGSSLALTGEVAVDVHRLRDCAELLIREPDRWNAATEEAAAAVLDSAELLPGWDDDWVFAARERLQYLRLGALEAIATRCRRQRRTHEALEAARAAIGIEPLRESAHRAIVQTHIDNGDLGEAVDHFEKFQAILDHELGLPPSNVFRQLISPYLTDVARRRTVRTQ